MGAAIRRYSFQDRKFIAKKLSFVPRPPIMDPFTLP